MRCARLQLQPEAPGADRAQNVPAFTAGAPLLGAPDGDGQVRWCFHRSFLYRNSCAKYMPMTGSAPKRASRRSFFAGKHCSHVEGLDVESGRALIRRWRCLE